MYKILAHLVTLDSKFIFTWIFIEKTKLIADLLNCWHEETTFYYYLLTNKQITSDFMLNTRSFQKNRWFFSKRPANLIQCTRHSDEGRFYVNATVNYVISLQLKSYMPLVMLNSFLVIINVVSSTLITLTYRVIATKRAKIIDSSSIIVYNLHICSC